MSEFAANMRQSKKVLRAWAEYLARKHGVTLPRMGKAHLAAWVVVNSRPETFPPK